MAGPNGRSAAVCEICATDFDDLSERELEVLSHVVRGKMNKEIAADLNINERTVKLHRTNITRKLKVQSVAELTRLADEARLFKSQTENNISAGPSLKGSS